GLCDELWMAMQGEEWSHNALDDLSIALSNVTTEARQRDCCRLQADECVAAWGDKKECVLIDCVHAFEDDSNRACQENTKLNACMRDILKQVVVEASVVRDSFELARAENSRLSRAITDKGSLRELNSYLATMTTTACSMPTSTKTSVSQRWMVYKPRTPSSRRRHSIGEAGKLMTGFS
ncbi:hypothetical protein ACJX0J_012486, partial [Zea mays]